MNLNLNLICLLYLVSGVCFIQALKGLSHPQSAVRGNGFGILGMALAIGTTVGLILQWSASASASGSVSGQWAGLVWVGAGLLVGGSVGTVMADRVAMTQMPELVAFMHSMVGLSAVLIALSAVLEPAALGLLHQGHIPIGNRLELALGAWIGAVTFTGSVIAFGKLAGRFRFRLFQGRPVIFRGQHVLNLVLGLAAWVSIGFFAWDQGYLNLNFNLDMVCFAWVVGLGLVLGVTLIIPIGGADMPVVVSMLNSYSGWAAAGIGFSLNNPLLIVAGSLVGSSGAILSYIMCKAMNRAFWQVILGGFGASASDNSPDAGAPQKTVKTGNADDVAFVLNNAQSVVIVPGYGLAVARAQHAVKELASALQAKGIEVKYAIHPVAGRMPGHMNVLLAEAEVPYDQVFEMDDINGEFGQIDVVMVLGANDVVNPAAHQKGSPIYGMPILEAYKARTVIVNKRSMAAGYAGLDNELFYMDKTWMVFGDAKKVIEDITKALG
jgi:NAD(P) transhydrogenase subunit beta